MSFLIFLVAILAAVAVALAVWALLHDPGEPPKPPRHAADGPGERESMARLRGETVPYAKVGGHPPWPIEDAGPLEPLPEAPTNPAVSLNLPGDGASSVASSPPRDHFAEADEAVRHAVEHFNPPKPAHESLEARFERLIGSRPAQVEELLHHHRDSDEAVHSIMMRTLDPELLARLDAARVNGQVDHG